MDIAVLAIVGASALLLCVLLLIDYALHAWRAERRAEAVVRKLLTPLELRQLDVQGYLEVASGLTPGRVYRIPSSPGLVTVIDSGSLVTRLCLQPAQRLPDREHVLLHKLLLEGAEDVYLKTANSINPGVWSMFPPR